MAKIKSTFFSHIVGKWGGSVFFKGRNGWIIVRNWVVPVDPATPYQIAARTNLANAAKEWNSRLTQAHRDSWTDYADGTPYEKDGEPYMLTGAQMYIAVRTMVLKADPTVLPAAFNSCSCEPGLFEDPVASITICATPLDCGATIKVTNNHPTTDMSGYIQLSPPQNQSIKFYKGPYDPKTYTVFEDLGAGDSEDVEFCDLSCEGSQYFFILRAYTSAVPYKISRVIRGSFIATCTPA